jgi:putative endonuclease
VRWYDARPVTHNCAGVRIFHVYILASRSHVMYIGVTSNLIRRVYQHRTIPGGFAAKYGATRLVYIESTTNARAAIAREKALKGWSRAKKIALIERDNPRWMDLARGWYE